MAIMFRGTGEHDQAQKILLEILHVDPSHLEAKDELIILSVMHFISDDYEKALEILIQLLHIDSNF